MPPGDSVLAERLLRVLTESSPEADSLSREQPDISLLTDEELGALLPAAYQVPIAGGDPASLVRMAVEDAVRERQPRFAPESCARMFAALVAGLRVRQWADLTLGVGSLLRCIGPWPHGLAEPAGRLVRFLLRHDRLDQPYALLAVAGLAGGSLQRKVLERLREQRGPIARDELDVISAWEPSDQALMSEIAGDQAYGAAPPPLAGAWERLAATDYAAFARRALEAAAARVAAIHSGELAYLADGAFTNDETEVLGRAARVALFRDEPWLADLLDRLLPGVAVAPTAARTLPSQALLFELARAVEDFPTAEAVAALRTARRVVRHKGVPKQLDRMLKRIERALTDRPGVLRLPDLGFGPDGTRRFAIGGYAATITVAEDVALSWHRTDGRTLRGVPATVRRNHPAELMELRDLVKQVRNHLLTLARALEAGYTADTMRPYGRWRKELATHPLTGTVAQRLIWEVEASPGRWQAVLPHEGGAEFHDAAGTPVPAPDPDAAIRLWHPIRARTEEVRAWRDLVTERRVRQPFKQAFREIYLLTPAELATRISSNRFAAHIVRYRQFYALVKGRGWETGLLGPWSGGDDGQAYGVFAAGSWRACLYHEYVEHA
jgi:hypothetical protein